MLSCSRLSPQRLSQSPPSLVFRVLCTYLEYGPYASPLCYRRLTIVSIVPKRFGSCCLKHPVRPILPKNITPEPLRLLPHHLPQESHMYALDILHHFCRKHPGFRPKEYLAILTSFFGVQECVIICGSNFLDPGS